MTIEDLGKAKERGRHSVVLRLGVESRRRRVWDRRVGELGRRHRCRGLHAKESISTHTISPSIQTEVLEEECERTNHIRILGVEQRTSSRPASSSDSSRSDLSVRAGSLLAGGDALGEGSGRGEGGGVGERVSVDRRRHASSADQTALGGDKEGTRRGQRCQLGLGRKGGGGGGRTAPREG
jgi:hypothetical protein